MTWMESKRDNDLDGIIKGIHVVIWMESKGGNNLDGIKRVL